MDLKPAKVYLFYKMLLQIIFILSLSFVHAANGLNLDKEKYAVENGRNVEHFNSHIILLDKSRQRRDTALPAAVAASSASPTTVTQTAAAIPSVSTAAVAQTTAALSPTATVKGSAATVNGSAVSDGVKANAADSYNNTTKISNQNVTTVAPTTVTKIPLLGVNGSGQFHGNDLNKTPKVSEPIVPDDNISIDVFKETPEKLKADLNITNIKYDNHTYYNSVFIENLSFFKEHWVNITKPPPEIHSVLSNSHRRATTLDLSFEFPFYGHPIKKITVATGGFIYTGDHVHNWLAATQYIAPLMANFDTTIGKDSVVKLFHDDVKFTALWENVSLQEEKEKNFTFAVTLYKNGDIIFAYKDIPIPIIAVNDDEHPVKIGISDAYLTDRIAIQLRTKTIYEYHRVSFKSYNITNNTVLKLIAQPTCLQYGSCNACVNHDTEFNCSWCEQIKKCSSGTDRKKQDWLLRNCDKTQISNESSCPASTNTSVEANSTSYVTDTHVNPMHDTVFKSGPDNEPSENDSVLKTPMRSPIMDNRKPQEAHSPIGGVVALLVIITLISSFGVWVLYAFKNPHTRSGQLLIKYRPSQWSWRRGEARYTAATIHM